MEKPDFLEKKYPDLPGSKPVERAVRKARTEEVVPDKKSERIQTYLNRLDNIVKDERGWELLKHKVIKEFAIDTDDQDTLTRLAHGLYESEKKMAIEQGRGGDIQGLDEADTIEKYKALVHEKRGIQEKTLTSWLDYLRDNDAQYPAWFRYFAVRNLQKMGTIDKERGEYTKRTDYTVAPFPELNEEALGFVFRMLTSGIGPNDDVSDPEKRQKLTDLIAKKDFTKLYTFAQIETAGRLNRESIDGQWIKYDQGSNHHILEAALRGKGTGWCTAEGSAYGHLQGGDFYVYYTKGDGGAYTEPRIAIRTDNGHVAEVRGVNHRQELEPALVDIATDQYHTLPDGEKFDKKSNDMRHVTLLMKKQESGESFAKDDLIFLYEINSTIEGFGYDDDPRIKELRSRRDPRADAPTVFECQPAQIAWSSTEIGPDTKAYIGPLFSGIFSKNIEHIATAFPEGNIRKIDSSIGGKTKEQLIGEMKKQEINVYQYAQDMLESKDFTFAKNAEQINLVRLTVKDLGFANGATTDQIYAKAQELGLDLCPAEVGPHLRLQYADQPLNEWIYIAMKPIAGRGGNPSVFRLIRYGDGLWLSSDVAGPGGRWGAGDQFVFALRK